MQASPNQTPRKPGSAEPLIRHACVVAIVRFVDGNAKSFYSRDIEHRNTPKYHNLGYWTQKLKLMIETESPTGWKGRVEEGAVFYCYDGNRGDKICQWSKSKGGWQPLN